MSYSAEQNRFNRALDAAVREWPQNLYNVIRLRDPVCPFHLEVCRKSESRGVEVFKVRVVLGDASDHDVKICQQYRMSSAFFTKLILTKERGKRGFKYINITEK